MSTAGSCAPGSGGFPRCPGRAAGVDDVENRIGLPQVIEELVAETAPLVRIRHKAGNVNHVDRDEPVSVVT